MRSFTARLIAIALVPALSSWACSNDCPNCPGPTASIKVSPDTVSVFPAKAVQLVALAFDANGELLTRSNVIWTSDQEGFATVDNTGKVSGIAAGVAKITAEVDGKKGTGTVLVVTSSTFSGQVAPIEDSSDGVLAEARPVAQPARP